MESIRITGDTLWHRMESAVERVRQRLQKSTAVLEQAGLPYAVVGGNAVRIWVAQIDEAAVRNTRDVDILIRRHDLPAFRTVMEAAGFVYRHSAGITMFLDDADSSARDAVHVVFADEMIRENDEEPNPDVIPYELVESFRTLPLETLVRMKLNSWRLKDRVHLVDMLDIGLIVASWPKRFPDSLAVRLQQLIDNPDA
jgi:hypothetical protein